MIGSADSSGGVMQKMFAGLAVTPEDWRSYFCEFHAGRPNSTPELVGGLVDRRGMTTYGILAASLPHDATTILDIGCGEGAFVPFCRAALPAAHVTGVDLCAESVLRAQTSFGDERTRFLRGDAGSLAMETGSVDAVVSHLSLFLIEPLEAALRELRRVLRTGGNASFVVDARAEGSGVFAALVAEAAAFLQSVYPKFRYATTNPDLRSTPALTTLLHEAGFDHVDVEPFDVAARADANAAAEMLLGLYIFGSVEPPLQQQFRAHILEAAAAREDARGEMDLQLSLRLVTCR